MKLKMLKKYPLAILYTLLLILSLLDYMTTIYCLENVPNCYETNPFLKTPDVMFKFKILFGVPAGIAGILVGFTLDKYRIEFNSKVIRIGYYFLLALLVALFLKSCHAVANNVDKILRYG